MKKIETSKPAEMELEEEADVKEENEERGVYELL